MLIRNTTRMEPEAPSVRTDGALMMIRSYYNGKWLNGAYQCCVRWMEAVLASDSLLFNLKPTKL